jgi:hypothetical protein
VTALADKKTETTSTIVLRMNDLDLGSALAR